MIFNRIRWIALLGLLFGLFILALSTRKTVNLVIDGDPNTFSTSAFTVGEFLKAVEVPVYEADLIQPSPERWLKDGDTISIDRARHAVIFADGFTYALFAVGKTSADLLAQAGVILEPDDQLLVNNRKREPDQPLPGSISYVIEVKRSFPISVQIGSHVRSFSSTASTIGQALWEVGIFLHTADVVDPPPETPLTGPTDVNITRSRILTLTQQDGTIMFRSTAATVGEALATAGVSLQGLDYSLPEEDSPLPLNGQIQLVRVTEDLSMEMEPFPFEVQYQPVSDLEIDERKVVEPGTYGIKTSRVRIRLEDGLEVSRQVESEFISQEPAPRIVGYGTKIVPRTLNTPDGVITYWRALNMLAVSYSPSSAGGSITASGLPLRKGLVAVDPTYISLGTRLYVPGYGHALAADTGGGVRGRIIDLGYSDDDYVSWRQWVTVYFLWPPPANVSWIIP